MDTAVRFIHGPRIDKKGPWRVHTGVYAYLPGNNGLCRDCRAALTILR